ncbi:hypothetical protein V6N13_109895 [Hibiscus sabdariffa]|uniref:Acyl-CoA oxidase C-terminal domain-containing protein n=1 Tax=Hibiscus sabdariffa TaxID=183260 RepID=A0ABR2FRD1_9ROSI
MLTRKDLCKETLRKPAHAWKRITELRLSVGDIGMKFGSGAYNSINNGVLANEHLRLLFSQVRPNAIPLVDAFNHTDHYLGSVLGRYDGNLYQKLYEGAWKDPLNETVVPDGYQDYIRPILKQQILTARL